jgi:hypothetical protein
VYQVGPKEGLQYSVIGLAENSTVRQRDVRLILKEWSDLSSDQASGSRDRSDRIPGKFRILEQ